MTTVIGSLAGTIYLFLALLHFYWAFGGRKWLDGCLPSKGPGEPPLFVPAPFPTAAVGILLSIAAAIVWQQAKLISTPLPTSWAYIGTIVLTILFGLRAIGEGTYCGFTKRVKGTPFAERDTKIYSPLCAALATMVGWLAWHG